MLRHKLPGIKKPEEIENQLRQQILEAHSVKKKSFEEGTDDWLITYADAITLIMVFIVLLFSFSEINQQKFEEVTKGIDENLLHKDESETINPLHDLNLALSQLLVQFGIDPNQAIKLNENSLKVELPGELLFKTASTEVEEGSSRLIEQIAIKINSLMLPNYQIEIEGHTDDVPIHTNRFPSNWELSSGRAIEVLKIFMAQGISQNKLKAIGYAETRPKVPNRTLDGLPIDENRSQNRRVEIKLTKIYGFQSVSE